MIIIIIISLFKEDNVFSMTVNLPYGPPVNTDMVIIGLFSDFFCIDRTLFKFCIPEIPSVDYFCLNFILIVTNTLI